MTAYPQPKSTPSNHFEHDVHDNNEYNEIRDLSTTGTPDTIPMTPGSPPIVNGISPDGLESTRYLWNEQFRLNREMLKQLILSQEILCAKGKKGFRFSDNPDHYDPLVTVYHE